eukprot:gb/GFBE01056895.1/.p1 GENE.gb/GFBE01056895.1/~~gb/GFBE01056895.1/.p1  ORF type:complete len:136 (+),score=12.24 gb/GFBE01056895.1/:1-408(+)
MSQFIIGYQMSEVLLQSSHQCRGFRFVNVKHGKNLPSTNLLLRSPAGQNKFARFIAQLISSFAPYKAVSALDVFSQWDQGAWSATCSGRSLGNKLAYHFLKSCMLACFGVDSTSRSSRVSLRHRGRCPRCRASRW